jgi:hypothetical protein
MRARTRLSHGRNRARGPDSSSPQSLAESAENHGEQGPRPARQRPGTLFHCPVTTYPLLSCLGCMTGTQDAPEAHQEPFRSKNNEGGLDCSRRNSGASYPWYRTRVAHRRLASKMLAGLARRALRPSATGQVRSPLFQLLVCTDPSPRSMGFLLLKLCKSIRLTRYFAWCWMRLTLSVQGHSMPRLPPVPSLELRQTARRVLASRRSTLSVRLVLAIKSTILYLTMPVLYHFMANQLGHTFEVS